LLLTHYSLKISLWKFIISIIKTYGSIDIIYTIAWSKSMNIEYSCSFQIAAAHSGGTPRKSLNTSITFIHFWT
jgi:hypothetical protein